MTKPNFAKDTLRSLVSRIERLEEEKAALGADIREVYAEAKGHGFDVKVMRKAIKRRAMDKAKREEEEALLDLYMAALEVSTVVQMRVVEPHAAAAQ